MAPLSRAAKARNRDVRDACLILESVLGAPRAENLAQGLEVVWERHDRPATWERACHLAVMYCLRSDWQSERDETLKLAAVDRIWAALSERFAMSARERRDLSRQGLSLGSPAWRRFLKQKRACTHARMVFADLLVSRGDFARVWAIYAETGEANRAERQLPAESCAGLAEQVRTKEELRDTLRYEVMDWYFCAGQKAVWRHRFAPREHAASASLCPRDRSENRAPTIQPVRPTAKKRPALTAGL